MSAPAVSNARLAVLLASLAAGGAVMHTANTPLLTVILITVALSATLIALTSTFIQRNPARTLLTCVLLAAVPASFYAYAGYKMVKPTESDLLQYKGRTVCFTAKVSRTDLLSNPKELTLTPLTLELPKEQRLAGKTQLVLRDCPELVLKNALQSASGCTLTDLTVRIRGRILEPRTARKPWEFDKKRFLAKEGIFSTCYLSRYAKNSLTLLPGNPETHNGSEQNGEARASSENIQTLDLANWYESQMVLGRKIIVETHRRFLPSKLADLLSSMVLGNRAIQLPKEITNEFRDVGLSHILAASGFNLTIVIAMTFAICRWLIPSAVLTNALCFAMMLTFVSLAGVSPSVLRAALMCTIMLLARCGQRKMLISSTLAIFIPAHSAV